jgi:hypothetical protein
MKSIALLLSSLSFAVLDRAQEPAPAPDPVPVPIRAADAAGKKPDTAPPPVYDEKADARRRSSPRWRARRRRTGAF